MLDLEDVEKIAKFSTIKIFSDRSDKNLSLALQKTGQLHFTRSHLYEKMSKMVVTLWIPPSRQVSYMHEKFQIIWNYVAYRKKIVRRKK